MRKTYRAHSAKLLSGLLAVCVTNSATATLPSMPSSGTCAMILRDQIPYGIDVSALGNAGYGFSSIVTLTFTNSTSGTISNIGTNVNYRTSDAPEVRNWGMLRNVAFTITTMNDGTTGIAGGYLLTTTASTAQFFNHTTGALTGSTEALAAEKWHVFPVNNGRTLLIQGGTYPFAGVCQF